LYTHRYKHSFHTKHEKECKNAKQYIFICIRQLLNIDILQQRPRKNPPNERKEENPGKVCISCRLLLALSIYSVLVSVGLQIILGMGGGRERGGGSLSIGLDVFPTFMWEITTLGNPSHVNHKPASYMVQLQDM